MNLPHGGQLRLAAKEYGIPLDEWLDLSTGINPSPYPVGPIPEECWHRLPEEQDGLVLAADQYYTCSHLLPIPGSQWAIQTLPLIRKHWQGSKFSGKETVLLPSTGYREHFKAWQENGFIIQYYQSEPSEQQLKSCDVCVILNPNNPSAYQYKKEEILRWKKILEKNRAWLIVDEAFIDSTPEDSLLSEIGTPGLIVLRSLGKFFGLAGVRVGFLFAEQNLLDVSKDKLGPWAVSNPSRFVASNALRDVDWQKTTRLLLTEHSTKLNHLLIRAGFKPNGTALFQTAICKNAYKIFHHCCEQGILLRLLDDHSGLRFGLPPSNTESWERLESILSSDEIQLNIRH